MELGFLTGDVFGGKLLQERTSYRRILVGHVCFGGYAEDFGGLAFRCGYDDLEAETRQYVERTLRVAAVGLDEGLVEEQRRLGGAAGHVTAE